MNSITLRVRRGIFLMACLVTLSSGQSFSEVSLSRLFTDHMVLQRGMSVPVWGWAAPGEKIRVELEGQKAETAADKDGKWMVRLSSLKAGGPFELKVSGKNTLVVKDVLVGEVWLCSGQSNMAMEVSACLNAESEMAAATNPLIRQFQVRRGKAETPRQDVEEGGGWLSTWVPASPETVKNFTGAGYFFARQLFEKLDVPIGIIHSSWGGTTAEAWTSPAVLEKDSDLKMILTNWTDYNNDEEWLKEQYTIFTADVEKWKHEGGVKPLYFNQPGVLYNFMIAPLIPYAIRGSIWYQGESNVFRAYQYRRLFPVMIRSWREAWGEGDFPFLFVQLANFNAGTDRWSELREAQTMALSLPHTGMASAIDIGEAADIHPKNKQEVGRRLALAARALVYGEKLIYSGPLYRSMEIKGNKCYISFDQLGDGLIIKGGGTLAGFVIAGEDRKFVPAKAEIEGERVSVSSDKVTKPFAVRYAWEDNPGGANLYNRIAGETGLPASPFRTDDWPGLTAGRK